MGALCAEQGARAPGIAETIEAYGEFEAFFNANKEVFAESVLDGDTECVCVSGWKRDCE